VNRVQLLDGLDLDDDLVLYYQVQPLRAQRPIAVKDDHLTLSRELQALELELDCHCILVDAFRQTGTQSAMDADCTADDPR
jgi:hypothetical protein